MLTNLLVYHTPLFYLIQSLWRDEAFSYFMAQPNILQIIKYTANDFNPPVYYTALHFWQMIVGKQDVFLRLLSFFAHLGTTYISWKFAKKFYSNRFALFVALFMFFNPMLLYYAFEIRMYAFYAFFTISSAYFFYTKQWRWYTTTAVLGLYTHSFFPLIICSYIIYLFIQKELSVKIFFRTILPCLFYLPWIPVIAIQFVHSKDSWIFPVDAQLVKSSLGNLFSGYEGTPGDKWTDTFHLSLIIILFLLLGLRNNKKLFSFFILPLVLPLGIILGYSFIGRPLYVNRYLIFVTVFEALAITLGIASIRTRLLRVSTATLWFALVIYINIWITPYHAKTDFKAAFAQINQQAKEDDYIFTRTPIAFLESVYYAAHTERVFVYNPEDKPVPNYIGAMLVFPDASRTSLPPAPSRTFLIDDDARYELRIKQ
jgi:mannosyltransferase